MVRNLNKLVNKKISKLFKKKYKYGFSNDIEKDIIETGLTKLTIKLISKKKKEPKFLLSFRLKAYKQWKKMSIPNWANLKISEMNYQNIIYYSAPKNQKKFKNLSDIDPNLINIFNELGISLNQQKKLTNIAIDAVFDSISIGTTFKTKLQESGIIFTSISKAIYNYPKLIKKYLSSVIPIGDNYFSALNSAIFTDGSFCYIFQNRRCPLNLLTYFRINEFKSGQFERTLIIGEKNSQVDYLEGCTASKYSTSQLHAAVVELIVLKNAIIKYSTVQNWYSDSKFGIGGIYNFVTKRGLCFGINSKISWTQIETGALITWKYPSCILIGNFSQGNFYSVSLTNSYQQADTGAKMVHIGKNTSSRIISKSISAGKSKNSYRGSVNIMSKAYKAKNYSQCDSLLIGNFSNSNTFPFLSVQNSKSQLKHEAYTSKIDEKQIFYLLQRGISLEKAIELIIGGFCREVFKELPLELIPEVNKLLIIKLEGSIG